MTHLDMTVGSHASHAIPAIRKIRMADLKDALAKGIEDFWAVPTNAEFLCIIYPVAALAKQFEELYLPDEREPIVFAQNSPALHLIQRVRDEAHRFAVAYHRSLRGKAQTASGLDGVPGIGPARKRALIRKFGSAAAIKQASAEELATVPGMTEAAALAVREALQKKD